MRNKPRVTMSTEQAQREHIKALRAEIFKLKNTAQQWENDYMHLRAELTFIQSGNDNLVEKLQNTRRALDEYQHAFGFKVPTTPENTEPATSQNPF